MREEMNRDIRPPAEIGDLTPELNALVYNDSLSAAFDEQEAKAVRWKRRYMAVGLTALLSSFVGTVALGYQVILGADWLPATVRS